MTPFAKRDEIREFIGFFVALRSEVAKRNDMMDIQLPSTSFFAYTALPASVVVSLACLATLALPIGAVVNLRADVLIAGIAISITEVFVGGFEAVRHDFKGFATMLTGHLDPIPSERKWAGQSPLVLSMASLGAKAILSLFAYALLASEYLATNFALGFDLSRRICARLRAISTSFGVRFFHLELLAASGARQCNALSEMRLGASQFRPGYTLSGGRQPLRKTFTRAELPFGFRYVRWCFVRGLAAKVAFDCWHLRLSLTRDLDLFVSGRPSVKGLGFSGRFMRPSLATCILA